MKYCLAIDIGASSGRHILAHVENGKIVLEEIYRFYNGADEKNGHLVWDTERLFSEILNGLKKAKNVGKIPAYVAVDTWGVDYALLDKDDKLLGEVFAYRDSRNRSSSEAVEKILPFSELYKKTGIEFAEFNTVYQLFDDKTSEKMEKAETFLELPDYFHFLLTGKKMQEYTNATTTALINTKTHAWDFDVIDKLGFKRSLFQTLSKPTTIVGPFKAEIEEIVGYSATVVLPATHDTASAVLAVPDDGKDEAYISSGTWSLMGTVVPEAITDASYEGKSFSNEGNVDYRFRFQTNIMGMWVFQNVKKEAGDFSFAELTKEAEAHPFSVPFDINDKRFFAPKNMTKTILSWYREKGLTPPNGIGELCYAVFLSLAECYKKTLRGMEAITGKTFSCLHIIGGGSQNALLNRLTAESCGIPVVAGPTEATAIGNVCAMLVAGGEVKDFFTAKKMIKESFDITEVKDV